METIDLLENTNTKYVLNWEILRYSPTFPNETNIPIESTGGIKLGKLRKKDINYHDEFSIFDNNDQLVLRIFEPQILYGGTRYQIFDSNKRLLGISKTPNLKNRSYVLNNSDNELILSCKINKKEKSGNIIDTDGNSLAGFFFDEKKETRGFLKRPLRKSMIALEIYEKEHDRKLLLGFFVCLLGHMFFERTPIE